MFFMAYSVQPTAAVDTNCGAATQHAVRTKAGGRYAADLAPATAGAGPVPSLLTPHSWIAPRTRLTPLRSGMM